MAHTFRDILLDLQRLQLLDRQQKYLQQVPVSYPLLTVKGTVPSFYRDIARYPAIFFNRPEWTTPTYAGA
jgi:hypothetical protein